MTTSHPDWLRRLPEAALSHWQHGWTTSTGPDFSAPPDSPEHITNVGKLVSAVGLRHGSWVHQVHGGRVVRAESPGFLGEADAVWTTQPGLGVIGRSADCPLILVMGSDAAGDGLWGFSHASWRSTVAGITTSLLNDMTTAGLRPERSHAVICPSAGPCCYEVGPEVYDQALVGLGPDAANYFPQLGARHAFDLWQANSEQLESAGVPSTHIVVTGVCTICGGTEFPSHRREQGRAGRFAAISGGPAARRP